MEYVIMICGFFGAWLLFAGPIWQAVIELQEEAFDHEAFDAVTAGIEQPPKVSRWWLLLPPVYFAQGRKSNQRFRDAVMRALPDEARVQSVNFLNKANGWFIVAGGAFLIGVKETWELCELFEWPLWSFILLVVAAAALAIANAIWRDQRTKKTLETADSVAENPASS